MRATVVVDEGVVCVLEGPLDLHDREGRAAYVDARVLRVLYAEPVTTLFIGTAPTALVFGKVAALLSDGDAETLIVEVLSIQVEEIDQVSPEVDFVC